MKFFIAMTFLFVAVLSLQNARAAGGDFQESSPNISISKGSTPIINEPNRVMVEGLSAKGNRYRILIVCFNNDGAGNNCMIGGAHSGALSDSGAGSLWGNVYVDHETGMSLIQDLENGKIFMNASYTANSPSSFVWNTSY